MSLVDFSNILTCLQLVLTTIEHRKQPTLIDSETTAKPLLNCCTVASISVRPLGRTASGSAKLCMTIGCGLKTKSPILLTGLVERWDAFDLVGELGADGRELSDKLRGIFNR